MDELESAISDQDGRLTVLPARHAARWVRKGLLALSGVIFVATLVVLPYSLANLQLSPSLTNAELDRRLMVSTRLLFTGKVFLTISVVLFAIAHWLRPAVSRRKRNRLLAPRFTILGLLGAVTVMAIAIEYPLGTFIATIVIPAITVVVAGAIAALAYSLMTVVHWFRRTQNSSAK